MEEAKQEVALLEKSMPEMGSIAQHIAGQYQGQNMAKAVSIRFLELPVA